LSVENAAGQLTQSRNPDTDVMEFDGSQPNGGAMTPFLIADNPANVLADLRLDGVQVL